MAFRFYQGVSTKCIESNIQISQAPRINEYHLDSSKPKAMKNASPNKRLAFVLGTLVRWYLLIIEFLD